MFSRKTKLDEASTEHLLQIEDKEAQNRRLPSTQNVLFKWKLLAISSTTILVLHVLLVSFWPSTPLLSVHS